MRRLLIQGILRLLLAAGGIFELIDFLTQPDTFKDLKTLKFSLLVGTFVTFQLISCFIIYMAVNAVREFMQKKARFRLMYIVNAIMTLALTVYFIIDPKKDLKMYGKITYSTAILIMLYFVAADFITLFLKKKNIQAPILNGFENPSNG